MQKATQVLDAVLLESTNPEALAEFYRKAFDLDEPKYNGDDHLGMNLANTYLGFDRVKERPTGRGAVQLWFRVEDVESKYQQLIALGSAGRMPPNREESPGEVVAVLTDPDANTLGLIADAA